MCYYGMVYAQGFNEKPTYLPESPNKIKGLELPGLPDFKGQPLDANPMFRNSLPLIKLYTLKGVFPNLNLGSTDYFNRQQHKLFNLKHISYELYGSSYSLKGIGTQNMAGGRLIYQPTDKLILRFGGNAYQFCSNGRMFNDFTFNMDATYLFNEWVSAQIYGQYSMYSLKNTARRAYPLSPKSAVGASLLFKVVDKQSHSIDLNLGAEHSYNPAAGRWETNFMIGPVIKLK